MADGASFLPRIESVFYAVFDAHQGPKIVHQVPEGLIATPLSGATSNLNASASNLVSPLSTPSSALSTEDVSSSARAPSSALSSPLTRLDTRPLLSSGPSPQKRAGSSNRFLFNFDDVSKYIIPHSALCGRLVKCTTRKHRIIGFPVELRGKYERNYFRYNLCFVFDKKADLSCYEPVVRKVSRVMTTCEEESAFLSAPQNSSTIYAILEQLYEDLNSYSETSIQIDKFNSIELKIFPFYPNPPPVKDWQVPLALINLTRRIEANWDLTIAKVCRYIDGVNHVARIARLADCDLELTRQAVSHLLYYQVIMMMDIFQYSNMYTLRKSVQWLADEPHVREECGPYVTRPEKDPPDWPRLLYLYSRLKPGTTILEWMEEHNLQDLGLDLRRFTSFGVVKGFLRRVHRWPVLIDKDSPTQEKRDSGFSSTTSGLRPDLDRTRVRARLQEAQPTIASAGAELVPVKAVTTSVLPPTRQTSAAETSLEQLRNLATRRNGDTAGRTRGQRSDSIATIATDYSRKSYPAALHTAYTHSPPGTLTRLSPDTVNSLEMMDSEQSSGGRSNLGVSRPRLSRSPSIPLAALQAPGPPYPPDLLQYLDGEHHTDEICTHFEVGWPILETWLYIAGGGTEDGDFGRIAMIYR